MRERLAGFQGDRRGRCGNLIGLGEWQGNRNSVPELPGLDIHLSAKLTNAFQHAPDAHA